MAEFSSIVGEVLPDVPGCTIPLAVRAIRDAVVEVCETAKLLKRPVRDQVVTADNSRVQIPGTTGFRLIHIQNAQLDKRDMYHASQDELDLAWRDRQHTLAFQIEWHHDEYGSSESWREYKQQRPRAYYLEKEDAGDFFRLVGIPTRGYTDLQYVKIICPTREATGIDTWFLDRYYKQIAMGAIAKLKAMGQQVWSDPPGAVYYGEMFRTWMTAAGRDAATDFNRDDETVGRVTPCY